MATKKGLPLNEVPAIPGEVVSRLAELWITTAEELVSAATQEGGLQGLAEFTGLPVAEVTQIVDQARAVLPPGVSFAVGPVRRHGLGALDEREPGDEGVEGVGPATAAPLPDTVDFHTRFGLPRDQGERGTCVAHACTAVREYLLGMNSPSGDFSEQFLYWACKRSDMLPLPGTFIRVGMNRLQVNGIPAESVWPYNKTWIPTNESQDPPPAGAETKALANRIDAFTRLIPSDVTAIRAQLAAGSPVAFAVPVYAGWFSEPTYSSGDVRLPLPGEKKEGGHALCMTGYQADPSVAGGGYFIVRNSWGYTTWGCDSAVAPGYARIPFAYIQQYCTSAFTAQMKPISCLQAIVGIIRRLLKIGYV